MEPLNPKIKNDAAEIKKLTVYEVFICDDTVETLENRFINEFDAKMTVEKLKTEKPNFIIKMSSRKTHVVVTMYGDIYVLGDRISVAKNRSISKS